MFDERNQTVRVYDYWSQICLCRKYSEARVQSRALWMPLEWDSTLRINTAADMWRTARRIQKAASLSSMPRADRRAPGQDSVLTLVGRLKSAKVTAC